MDENAFVGLTGVDYAVLLGYLAVVVAIGIYFSRGTKNTEDYLLGGRRIPWWAAGISYMVSVTSTLSFVAVPRGGLQIRRDARPGAVYRAARGPGDVLYFCAILLQSPDLYTFQLPRTPVRRSSSHVGSRHVLPHAAALHLPRLVQLV